MELFKRKLTLETIKERSKGLLYNTIIPGYIYFNIKLIQTIDDMGLVEDLPFIKHGDTCSEFTAGLNITNITCFNPENFPPNTPAPSIGSMSVMVSGGIPPYTYEWSNGSESDSISGLPVGGYSVRVKDSIGCELTVQGEISITPKSEPRLLGLFTQHQFLRLLTVNGGSSNVGQNGYIRPQEFMPISNLLVPYNINTLILCSGQKLTLKTEETYQSYLWSNGSTSQSITIDTPGTYTVNTIDNNGCEGTNSVTVDYYYPTAPNLQTNKPPISGDGTVNNPYVFCDNQFPVFLSLTNPQNFNFWTWNTGSSNISNIQLPLSYTTAGYGFTGNGSGLSTICCPVGVPAPFDGCQAIQYPLVWVRYSNLPLDGCGTDNTGIGVSG